MSIRLDYSGPNMISNKCLRLSLNKKIPRSQHEKNPKSRRESLFWFFFLSFFSLRPKEENKVGNVKNLYTYRHTLPKYSFSSPNLGLALAMKLLENWWHEGKQYWEQNSSLLVVAGAIFGQIHSFRPLNLCFCLFSHFYFLYNFQFKR